MLSKGTTRKITSQEGGFLNFIRSLMTTGLSLMKNVLAQLDKGVLMPLGLLEAVSATDAAIEKNIFVPGTTALIISNEEIEHIKKIVKSLEESGLLTKDVNEAIKNDAKEEKGGFLGMLLGKLVARLLGSALAGKGVIRAGRDFNAALSFN